jgi:DNA-binding IclR family transcriptional regulator
VAAADRPRWTFLTNHARVLICVADDAGIRLREIGARVGITERAAHNIVVELEAAGYVKRRRNGRRNHYTVNPHLPLLDPLATDQRVGDLLEILAGSNARARASGKSE